MNVIALPNPCLPALYNTYNVLNCLYSHDCKEASPLRGRTESYVVSGM